MSKKVAIIGGGCSGLISIKCCLEECLEPVCFERTDEVGGLWNYTEDPGDKRGCVMRSTVIDTSKEAMAFSDFPPPETFPNYMHNTKVWKYFSMYADHFGLRKYIRFSTEVLSIYQTEDFAKTGQWVVESKSPGSDDVKSEVYDAVMLCTGHHTTKKMPEWEGQDEFQGELIHTHDYKSYKTVEGKRVVICGIGNSGADATVEAGRVSKQAFLSTRRGAWVLYRVGASGYPFDLELNVRFMQAILGLLPRWLRLWYLERTAQNLFKQDLFAMRPLHRLDGAHPMVCDELSNRIACGSVIVKTDIKRLTRTGVEFVDGTFEDNIDMIVCATGYVFDFNYVKHPALEVKDNIIGLYKLVFPPDIQPSTLAIIGLIQPWGAIMPAAELQARLATRVFKGVAKLPEPADMWKDVKANQEALAARYVKSTRHTLEADMIPYMDGVARLIGCAPDFKRLWLSDPRLAYECVFGPMTPYQFRLHGPGRWEGAREAILTQWDRIHKPLQTRPPVVKPQNNAFLYYFVATVLVLCLISWIFL